MTVREREREHKHMKYGNAFPLKYAIPEHLNYTQEVVSICFCNLSAILAHERELNGREKQSGAVARCCTARCCYESKGCEKSWSKT